MELSGSTQVLPRDSCVSKVQTRDTGATWTQTPHVLLQSTQCFTPITFNRVAPEGDSLGKLSLFIDAY